MKTVACIVWVCAIVAFWSGCSKQSEQQTSADAKPQQTSVITLAFNERGAPQFDYRGPGKLNYKYSLDTFSYQIDSMNGSPWVTGKSEIKFSENSHMTLVIQSSADRPYEIEMLGVWTNRNSDIPEDKAKERLRVPAGEQKLNSERFVIWTYDFAKEK